MSEILLIQEKQLVNQEERVRIRQYQERGSILIFVVLTVTVLLSICAIVTDVGMVYVQKAKLQNSVDAAALAGVQELLDNPSYAEQTASTYASQNGAPAVDVTIENNEIEVLATKQVPTFFARIWGINEKSVSASAKAILVPPTGIYGAVPLSIQEQDFVYGQKYVLKSGGGSGTLSWYLDDDKNNSVEKYGDVIETPGWYGALDLSGLGANSFEEDLANGYQGTLRVGQILNVKHGNMSGPTAEGINTRLSYDTDNPPNTIDNFKRDAPELIYVPVIKILAENGNSINQVQITGFAAFFLEGVAGNGNNSVVTGWFIKTLASNQHKSGELPLENNQVSNDFGLYTSKLVQ